jgi:hypothetical protein
MCSECYPELFVGFLSHVSHACILALSLDYLCYFNLILSCVTSCCDIQVNVEETEQSAIN